MTIIGSTSEFHQSELEGLHLVSARGRMQMQVTRILGRGVLGATLCVALVAAACGGGSNSSSGSSTSASGSSSAVLGPVKAATGTPVKIGLVSDGKSPSIDNSS